MPTPEQITLTVDGFTLRGLFQSASNHASSVVLFVHGYGSRRDGEKAEALHQVCQSRGWSFAAFNHRGHGDSDGTLADLRGEALQADLTAIAAFLATRGLTRLYLVGSSMGGWASAWFAARRPDLVVAVVTIAPAFAFPRVRWERLTDAERDTWRTQGKVPTRNEARGTDEQLDHALVDEMPGFHPGTLAAAWTVPLLIFHGMLDEVVPYTHSLAFVEQLGPGPEVELILFRRGDHRLQPYRYTMAETSLGFFERHARSD